MNRLMIASAVAIAIAAVSVPAVAGLANNPSFSHQLPVRVPSQAKVVQLDDQGKVINTRRASDDSPGAATVTHSGEPEPGGDNGGQTTAPSDAPTTADPSDAPTTAEPSDGGKTGDPSSDHGGKSSHGG